MRILFDQGVPLPLKGWFASHHDLFITTDHNLHHQLDLSRFEIAVLVLMVANWPALEPYASEIAAAVDKIGSREYVEWIPP